MRNSFIARSIGEKMPGNFQSLFVSFWFKKETSVDIDRSSMNQGIRFAFSSATLFGS